MFSTTDSPSLALHGKQQESTFLPVPTHDTPRNYPPFLFPSLPTSKPPQSPACPKQAPSHPLQSRSWTTRGRSLHACAPPWGFRSDRAPGLAASTPPATSTPLSARTRAALGQRQSGAAQAAVAQLDGAWSHKGSRVPSPGGTHAGGCGSMSHFLPPFPSLSNRQTHPRVRTKSVTPIPPLHCPSPSRLAHVAAVKVRPLSQV